jgi:hypothetical protein
VATANGTEISNLTPTLICSQNIVLTNSFFFNNKVFGLLGNIGLVISASRTLGWSAKIGKNGATPADVVGYGYFSDVASITVPVNLISNIASGFQTFSIGDTVRVEIYAQNVGAGSNPTVLATVPVIQGVYNALSNTNPVIPASGTLSPVSVSAGPQLISPANTYQIQNLTGDGVDLYLYPLSTLTRTFNTFIVSGETSGAFTSAQYYDVVVGTAPLFPTSPITITSPTSETPIGIDPLITYTLINDAGQNLVLKLYNDENPSGITVADPFLAGDTYVATSAGFTGYTATAGAPIYLTDPRNLIGPVESIAGPLDPSIAYAFYNQYSSDLVLTGYNGTTPTELATLPATVGEYFMTAGAYDGYTATLPVQPPAPNPYTITESITGIPVPMDPNIRYEFINSTTQTARVYLYTNGSLGGDFDIPAGESGLAFYAGFTGFLVDLFEA